MLLSLRKWLGTWWGEYCPLCGDKYYFDNEAFWSGWNVKDECHNINCSNYFLKGKI